jgi:hypothetical protein
MHIQEVVMETHGQLSPGPSSHLPEITEEPNYQAITEQKQPPSQHHQPLSPQQSQQLMPPDSSAIIYQVILPPGIYIPIPSIFIKR